MRIAVRAYQQPGVARRLLQEREEHRRLLFLGKRPVFSVFNHAHHFSPLSAPELEMAAYRLVHRSENLDGKLTVDEGHLRRLGIVSHGEVSACQQPGSRGSM